MNKSDLAKKVATDAEISLSAASKAVNVVFDGIIESLTSGEKVTIVGFGTFKTSIRKARTGRNPQTGEPMTIPEKRMATFSAGKELKDKVAK